ncbi:MAG: peptidoglycan DD-metalloendopeptidase family protein [Cytophagales bacterium]|nr:peptidoglycan DD-metalloendopeptidase family protein [Cytophagales bacterium]
MCANKLLLFSFLFSFSLFSACPLHAQSKRRALEKQKLEVQQKIRQAYNILKESQQKKEASLGKLNALKHSIKMQHELIDHFQEENKQLETEILSKSQLIGAMQQDMEQLKKEYALMLYEAQKTGSRQHKLGFLFASSSFRELYLRMKYLEQYAEARNKQLDAIDYVRKELDIQKKEQTSQLREKKKLLGQRILQKEKLLKFKQSQEALISQLNRQQGKLKRQLKKEKKSVKRLERLIADVVRAELKKTASRRKKKNASANKRFSAKHLSFSLLKRKLDWPVNKGFIAQRFGKHPHPILKGIMIQNQGVDIQTSKGESVKVVRDGVVKSIAVVPGLMRNVVIVQHDPEYFTVYAKLSNVQVKTGQELKTGDSIGKVTTDSGGISELQFQVWNKEKNLNPELWLKRR